MSLPSLRVLMTVDAVGGVWVYATNLARSLCEQGCHVRLVTLGPPPRKDQLQAVGDLDLTVTDLALEWVDAEAHDHPRALESLALIAQYFKPQVVHLNGYREAAGEWNAPVLVVAHSCVRSWWRACRGEDPCEPRWLAYMSNVRAGLVTADVWAAPTAAFRDTVQELYDPPTAGRVIWNGLDRRVGSTAKEPVILVAGRLWDEAKNVAAVAAIAARMPWPIRIAGPQRSAATGDAAIAGATQVQPLGELSHRDLMREMARAAIFVAPALYEPFGLTVLEAGLAGCALVLSDTASFRELWDGAALFVDPRDRSLLQSALVHLTRNDALRRDLQQRAASRAQCYSLAAMTDSYRRLYASMARSSDASRQWLLHEARP